jgi:hypothetical protein
MKRTPSNSTIVVLTLMLVLVAGPSVQLPQWAAHAQEPDRGTAPQEISAPQAPVEASFTYQGVLKENGSPVTGSRDVTFRLYSDDTCTAQVGSDIDKPGVPVANGLFSVELDVTHSDFNGQGLWLEVEVGGTSIGCQEILPVPYALSLRPGATIRRVTAAGNGPAGTALTIANGGIKVSGAGQGTNTPVFIHKVNTDPTYGNLCIKGLWQQYYSTVIDHPLLNGNPGAMLFVTPNYGLASSDHVGPAPDPYAVYYDDRNQCGFGADKWVIYNWAGTTLNDGQLFNVMVVLP